MIQIPLFRYPRNYGDIISDACSRYSVSAPLVYAVIYAESGFQADAVSAAGAVGLMQLMPATARWCAEKTGAEYSEAQLAEPSYNVELGVYYLSYLLKRFDERDAVAAYNAGEGNVAAWLAQDLKEIPFLETRQYVKRVFSAKRVYEFFGM